MTREDLLLLQIMEECNEISQAVSKRLRFGKDHTHPTVKGTTTDRIVQETIDLAAVLLMCEREGILPEFDRIPDYDSRMNAKIERVEKYLLLSQQEGRLS